MIPTTVLVKLATLGLSEQQAEAVGEMLSQVEAATRDASEEVIEKSREKARARLQKWKDKQPQNVLKRSKTLRNAENNSHEGVTRGEDNLQTKKISGQEEKKDTSPPARSKRGERIPENFSPDIEAAVSEGLSRPEAERQARSFCDYWRAKPGKDGLKLDWQATWRVWYRRHLSSAAAPPRHSADPPHRMDRVNAILDEMQGKSHVPQHPGPNIDGSVERTDWSGTPNLVQLHAVSARGRS